MSHLLDWPIPVCTVSSRSASTDHLTIRSPFLQVLAREDGRCPVSGRADYSRPPERKTYCTHCICAILSVNHSQGESNYLRFSRFNWIKTARAGTIIERFGGFPALDLLGPENIHNPLNAMALSPLAYQLSDELGIRLIAARGGLVLHPCVIG